MLHRIKLSNSRTALLAKNVFASFFVKGWSALVVLIMVPLTLRCLGNYQNGVWLTISSLLVWIDQMDIGLGNGLRNKLATHIAHGEKEEARKMVSSTLAMLCCITMPLCIVLSVFVWTTNVYGFLNVDEALIPELRVALASAVILMCLTFILKFVNNVYMGLQLPAISNLIMALSQTLALLFTWLLLYCDKATFLNVVVANTLAPLVVYIVAYPVTFYVKYKWLRPSIKSVDLRSALELGNIGVKFFWLQIAAIIQFMTANILISKFFTPEMVTPYQITYRYMSLVLVAFTVVCMPFWNATTDAYERGDIQWIRNADRRMNFMTGIVAVALVFMTIASPWVYSVWIGNDCHVPFYMSVMMAIYIYMLVVSMRYSYFLNGVGALRLQLYMTVSVLVFIPMAYIVSVVTHSIVCFMAVMCICIAPSIAMNAIQFHKIINGTAQGIWKMN